jgi:predicted XRE-type DNA-binding protein
MNVTTGSDNVFADMGIPDPDTHLLKAELELRTGDLIKASKLTQAEAADRRAMAQPDVSKMLRGQFRPMSLERLMRCIVSLGQNVTIDVAAPADTSTARSTRIHARVSA